MRKPPRWATSSCARSGTSRVSSPSAIALPTPPPTPASPARASDPGDKETAVRTAQAGVASAQVYALLADGTTVEIRPAGPDDFGAVKAMHEALSPENTYLRFFNLSRMAADTEARRICRDPSPDQVALLALSDGEVVGCASYVTVGERAPGRRSGAAEIAFAVADHMHHL